MCKDVIVSISGVQFYEEDTEPVEVISVGEYYERNGKIYIIYDEVSMDDEEHEQIIKSKIKVTEDQVELIRKGATSTHMIFEKGKMNLSSYQTPFGDLLIGVHTTRLKMQKDEDCFQLQVDYGLDVNYSHVSDCNLVIKVTSRKEVHNYRKI